MYSIENKFLQKGFYEGWKTKPSVIILHYTAGYTEKQCYDILKKRGLSVHFCIERNGQITRYVFDSDRALHAGSGNWLGLSNMNHYSFGIEIVNFGFVLGEFKGSSPHYVFRYNEEGDSEINVGEKEWYRNETYKSSGGKIVTTTTITRQPCKKYPDHRDEWSDKLWASYPEEQIEATCQRVWEWMKDYDIIPENVIGHEHVSPGRKSDPGPAFPWRKVNDYLIKKAETEKPQLIDPSYKLKERNKALQSQLNRLGLPVGYIDGIWGAKTKAATEDAFEKFSKTYNFKDIEIDEKNIMLLANELKLITGFDPGRY